MRALIHRHDTDPTTSVRSSRRSDESYESQSTAPTSIYESPPSSPRPASQPVEYYDAPCEVTYEADDNPYVDARASSEIYASTAPSVADIFDEPESYNYEELSYHVPEYKQESVRAESKPSTPQDFAQYFPSQKRLFIHHDESSSDGNMNLRVDTDVNEGSRTEHVQIFHLRMHDLNNNEFSLRRYCRDSGREVCHSSRRFVDASHRPGLQRSMSSALASLHIKPDFKRSNSGGSSKNSPQRQDSGYGSDEETEIEDEVETFMRPKTPAPIPTNITKLEFSNYAQVDLRRRGSKQNKRYDFEYWGVRYTWKRVIQKVGRNGERRTVSFHLVREGSGSNSTPVAHIVPELRSQSEIRDDERAGGWVPPCSMWISDASVLSALTDVAEVIVATGLIALVDDCIKRHFAAPPKPRVTRQLSLPLTPLKVEMEFVGPKAMMQHVFRRCNSADVTGSHQHPNHGQHHLDHSHGPQYQQHQESGSPHKYRESPLRHPVETY